MNAQNLSFPVGPYVIPETITSEQIQTWIDEIASFPTQVQEVTQGLSQEQLNWRYRPGGWKIKQVVHHCADSHINAMIRFKLALTEDKPTIRPYFEARWAELPDSLDEDLSDTLTLLHGLHNRWVKVLKNLQTSDLSREFIHPEYGQSFSLAVTIGNYAWHCRHHFAHIQQALRFKENFPV